jgi:hypothetical protein
MAAKAIDARYLRPPTVPPSVAPYNRVNLEKHIRRPHVVSEGRIARMEEPVTAIRSDLVDLTGVALDVLASSEDPELVLATGPLLRQIDSPSSSIGGHDS